MFPSNTSTRLTRPFGFRVAVLLQLSASLVAPLAAQTATTTPPAAEPTARTNAAGKKVLSVADYSRWRSIDNALIASDGKWVAYSTRLSNTLPADAKPSLTLRNTSTNQDVVIANASNATFSPDARWVVYQIDSTAPPRGARDRAATAGTPPADTVAPSPQTARAPESPAPALRRFELRELATGRTQVWADMQSAVFSRTSTHLVLRRRAAGAGAAGGRGGAGDAAPATNTTGPRGTDVVLHVLATGRSLFLGSVADIAFTRAGDLLAYTVDATARDGNGIFVIDLATGRTQALDNDARLYSRLAWSDDGNMIAALKGREVEKMRERDNLLIAFSNVRAVVNNAAPAPVTLNPASTAGFPRGMVVSERAPLAFSDDGKRVFFGAKPQVAAPDTGRRRSTDSIADVDVWRTQDERVQSEQMIRAEADRNITYRQAFDISSGKFIPLADSTMRDIEIAAEGKWAVGQDPRAFISDYKRPAADFYRVNTMTGERTPMLKGQLTGRSVFGISPDGQTYLYWKDNLLHAYALEANTSRVISRVGAPSFTDREYDNPGPRPSYGVAGYSTDGKSVIAQHRFDLWALSLDGSATARNLTNGVGSKEEIRFRVVPAPVDSMATRRERTGDLIDLSKPVTLSAYGEYTKKSGFYTLNASALTPLLYTDASYSAPIRATKSTQVMFTRQTFVEFPDIYLADATLQNATKISDVNPQQAEYAWGRRVLFDYKSKDGVRLQGILALPDDYKAGEKRPMIVTFYEKNSQNMHRYSAPSYLTGMGASAMEAVSRGYITMLPDVLFHTGRSHSDMLEAVEAATRKVIEMGYVDPKRIGVSGHSYGGEGAAFIGTQSKLFAAIGMGAGVTDLFSDFSQSWGWSYQVSGGSGQNGNDYYMFGQGRWGFSPWNRPDVYHRESALFHAPKVTAPFLIMHGTADPTVSFSEGMNFYNALRFNGKTAAMLAYPGEGHGLRGLANRRDLTIRYFQFFDHYLKGEPAPKWLTSEVPYLVKDAMKDPQR